MGIFGKKKKDDASDIREGAALAGGATVEPISQSNEELQNLLNEFREMRNGSENRIIEEGVQEAEEVAEIEDEYEGGEEYEVSETESESIEDFLSFGEEAEEEIEEEVFEEPIEEEVVEDEREEVVDEYIEDELDEPAEENLDDAVEVDVEISDPGESEIEDELEEEVIAEEADFEEDLVEDGPEETFEIEADENEFVDELVSEEIYDESGLDEEEMEIISEEESAVLEPVVEPKGDFVTSEDIDKKFDDFEKRLLDKLMAQFSKMQPVMQSAPISQPVSKKDDFEVVDDEELRIETINGRLVINGYMFSGEVVMFTPISSLKKASWEEVVRRKGHCTYHLTTSGNGGWFIKKSNAPNPYAYIEKKEEAEELAKFYAKREKAELKIHNSKGVIEKSLSFGREKLRG